MLDKLSHDLINNIMLFLPYKRCVILNDILKLNNNEKETYTICQQNNELYQKILMYYSLNGEFYEMTRRSIYNIEIISDMLHNIGYNMIDKYNNKLFVSKLKYEDESIEDTIKICMILSKMTEKYIKYDFRINNPYITLQTNISANMINYFIDVLIHIYGMKNDYNEINKKIIKFRLMVYQYSWYDTTINMLGLFKLYVHRLGIFKKDISEIKILNTNDKPSNNTIECLEQFNKLIKIETINQIVESNTIITYT